MPLSFLSLNLSSVPSGVRQANKLYSDEEVRARYGSHAVISRKDKFVLVHLDDPGEEVVRSRTEAFDPDHVFDEDCPLCAVARARNVFVYEDYPDEEDEILID